MTTGVKTEGFSGGPTPDGQSVCTGVAHSGVRPKAPRFLRKVQLSAVPVARPPASLARHTVFTGKYF